MTTSMKVRSYQDQNKDIWPNSGQHILANYDQKTIVVYQALSPEIAEYAVKHGQFGGPKYSVTRMTWIKTSFLWVMYKSGWATKQNQTRIVAIHVRCEGFDEILRCASEGKGAQERKTQDDGADNAGDVRLEWDSDHNPTGGKQLRQAIQLGLRGDVLHKFNNKWITRIEDITDFVKKQQKFVKYKKLQDLLTPEERCYVPKDPEICQHIRLDGFEGVIIKKSELKKHDVKKVKDSSKKKSKIKVDDVKTTEGAACSELLDEQTESDSEKLKNKGSMPTITITSGACCSELLEETSDLNNEIRDKEECFTDDNDVIENLASLSIGSTDSVNVKNC